jgi:hypothetical protein
VGSRRFVYLGAHRACQLLDVLGLHSVELALVQQHLRLGRAWSRQDLIEVGTRAIEVGSGQLVTSNLLSRRGCL